ncbi:MAG: DUF5058 family protein [Treponemataceae bacterium]|nr:DUF5058 family protein [Spirochaetales bacterium]MDY6030581.1 DUF5058 family protein [Treponemataceae bacterium]
MAGIENLNKFNVNSTFLYIVASCVIAFVLAQSLFFLIISCRRAKTIGMDMHIVWKTIGSTALFTLAPAFSILLGVVTLSAFLGLPLPWIRLSVIGAITYELPAATSTAKALGISLSETIKDPKVYSAIAWVMTLGILPSILLTPILIKKIQKGVIKIQTKDSAWGDIFMTSLFMGMISAFSGMVFSHVRDGVRGLLPISVLFVSATIMGICGLLVKKAHIKWLENYAMPFSMLISMAFAALAAPLFGV